ncbi:hypothetical protein ACQY0O_004705 [Thecaphora frezii]
MSSAVTGSGGLARPIPRKASNGSGPYANGGGSEGSPEQASPEARRTAVRPADRGLGGGAGGGAATEASRRTSSPARGAYPGKPISPRLSPYNSGVGGHARRISSELSGPPRAPSPILLPSTSPPTATAIPDNHSWDSIWPRSPTPDWAQQTRRIGSLSPPASSSSPLDALASGSRPPSHSSPLLSRSPRTPGDLSGSPYSTSPTIGKPKARRPHELRGSSSSPTLRVTGFPATSEEPGSPRSLRNAPTRQRVIETSRSEPIPRMGFDPVAAVVDTKPPSVAASSQPSPIASEATMTAGEAVPSSENDATATMAASTSVEPTPTLDEDRSELKDTMGRSKPSLSILTLPASSAGLKLFPTSPKSPFLQLSSPPALSALQQDAQLAESPPKTRSFIAMPPRSGYELSDDPDDVGSEEDGSSSGQGSVGTNDEDDESNDDGRDQYADGFDDDVMEEAGAELDRDASSDNLYEQRKRAEAPNGPLSGVDGNMPTWPLLPKRPSLTRSNAVPAPPAVLDPLAAAQSSTRALAAQKGPEGASLLTFFKEQYEHNGNGDAGTIEADSSMTGFESQIGDAVQPSALGLDAGLGEAMDENIVGDASVTESVEESLNTLERIFLFAKSDMAYHRVLVASSLPDWIRDVELSDAVEYIIPLLNGLGTDELDVCAAFAPELSRLMWFFFRNCPLTELPHEGLQSEARQNGEADDAGAKDAAEAQTYEVATRPRISVSTFTSLLCALLLNQNNLIAGATQQALVQFFCRLENRDIDVSKEELNQKSDEQVEARKAQLHMDGLITYAVGRDGQPVPHEVYDFGEGAKQAIRSELLDNVAFAIARLSQDQARNPAQNAMDEASFEGEVSTDKSGLQGPAASTPDATTVASEQGSQPPADEVASIGDDGSVGHEDAERLREPPALLLSESQDGQQAGQGEAEGSSECLEEPADTDMLDESQLLESWNGRSSPFAYGSTPNMSDYKADIDEEAAVGRMASVSLLAALCAEELIPKEVLLERTLPEVLALANDAAFFVRKEVAGALGPLAKNLDHETVTEKILPAFHKAMDDRIWHVRLAACFSLPAVLGPLHALEKREKTVSSLRTFVNDVSRKVRLAALEIIGEAIFMFKDDERGIPDELIRFFIGEPFDAAPQKGEASLSFDQSFGIDGGRNAGQSGFGDAAGTSAVNDVADEDGDSLLASFGFAKGGDTSLGESRWGSEFGTADIDPERPLVMAFNIPAVVLTLGRDKWPQLRKTYAELTEHLMPNVRKSLAASVHEIAKIVGPEFTKSDLLPVADKFLGDSDQEVRMAVLESIDVFLNCLPKPDAERCLQRLLVLWSMDFARDWRLRERLTLHIPSMARQFLLEDEDGNLVSLMQLALADPVSAVRDAGVKCAPDLYRTFAEHDQVIADGFLGMVSDLGDSDGYRLRVACLLCIQALVEKGIQRSSCELLLVGRLVQMGGDPVVDVRIALARTVGLMCRRDELYALPQSRSDELNSLLARLGQDRCAEVSDAVAGILTPAEASRYSAAASLPVQRPRTLVLGPAEGGPHKPESSSSDAGPVTFGENVLPLFDMDEGHDLEDVDMDGDDDRTATSADLATSNPDHHYSLDADTDHALPMGAHTAEVGDSSFDDIEAPHHLLGVDQDGTTDRQGEQDRPAANGDAAWLSSPQRPQPGVGQESASSTDAAGEGVGASPGTKTKGADPFLAFVADRRSQDLSRLNLDFKPDRSGDRRYDSGAHEHEDEADAPSTSGDGSATALTESRLRHAEEAGESLRSPGSSEDGSTGRRSAPSSGDWSQLRGDLPSSQQGAPESAGEQSESVADGTPQPTAPMESGTDEDFVTVDAEDSS